MKTIGPVAFVCDKCRTCAISRNNVTICLGCRTLCSKKKMVKLSKSRAHFLYPLFARAGKWVTKAETEDFMFDHLFSRQRTYGPTYLGRAVTIIKCKLKNILKMFNLKIESWHGMGYRLA